MKSFRSCEWKKAPRLALSYPVGAAAVSGIAPGRICWHQREQLYDLGTAVKVEVIGPCRAFWRERVTEYMLEGQQKPREFATENEVFAAGLTTRSSPETLASAGPVVIVAAYLRRGRRRYRTLIEFSKYNYAKSQKVLRELKMCYDGIPMLLKANVKRLDSCSRTLYWFELVEAKEAKGNEE